MPNGDIYIGGSRQKQKNKKLLTVICVLITVIAVGVIIFAISSSTSSLGKVEKTFYQYANILISGDKSTEPISNEYVNGANYHYLTTLSDQEATKKLLADAPKTKLANAAKNWKTETDNQRQIVAKIENEIAIHDFLIFLYSKPQLLKSNIIDYYFKHNREETEKYINDYYSSNSNNIYIKDLQQETTTFGKAVLANIDIYNNLGCTSEKYLNLFCFEQNANTTDRNATASNDAIISSYQQMVNGYNSLNELLIRNLFEIKNLINKEGKNA